MDALTTLILLFMLNKLKIDDTDIFLEDLGPEKGKIIIANPWGHNYSYFWGAMGGDLKYFLCKINSSYFADKLMGAQSNNEMDAVKTFRDIRKFIATEFDLPWYKHREFQKDMRETLNDFQRECESNRDVNYFVSQFFPCFVDKLDYDLIEIRREREKVKSRFKGISEHWYFIVEQPNAKYRWLVTLHEKLKKQLA